MPGATEGLINIFEVDSETMIISEEAKKADIEKYGLYTYEEFAEIMPIPEEFCIYELFYIVSVSTNTYPIKVHKIFVLKPKNIYRQRSD